MTEHKTFQFNDFLADDESLQVRDRRVNYIQMAINTVDGYPFGLIHGVQKDAIQNGWDACEYKSKNHIENNWRFEFNLFSKDGYKFLSMTDKGTTGLTGLQTAADLDEDSLPAEEERWARWESLAVPKQGEESLGARGMGKMILIAASKDYAIVYDSLRPNGTYRVGMSQATHSTCKVMSWNGEEGKKKIKKNWGLEPLNTQGTRVLIINPVDQLINAIETSEFQNYIAETWWPVVHKYNGKINIITEDKNLNIEVPSYYPITKDLKETKNFKTWIKDNIRFDYNHKTYRIKHIAFACSLLEDVEEPYRGISVFRRCMKVPTLYFANRDLRNKVYGFVEFEDEVDNELRGLELTNHYDFKDKGIWRKIKDIIETELDAFGNEKLGLGVDRKKEDNTKRNSAENKALEILKILTKGWDLEKLAKGTSNNTVDPPPPPSLKDISVQLNNIRFPNANIPRLNYGDSLGDFYSTIKNITDNNYDVSITVNIFSGVRTILNLDTNRLTVNPKQSIESKPYSFKVDTETFPEPGEYKIRATIKNNVTNEKEDDATRTFWVETDPPIKKGLFDIQRANFSQTFPGNEKLEWNLESKGSGEYVLFYNYDHPAYLHYSEDESTLVPYLTEIFSAAALHYLIKQIGTGKDEETIRDKVPFDVTELLSSDPKIFALAYARTFSILKSQIYDLL